MEVAPGHLMGTVSSTTPQILIADDQPAILDALRLLLKQEGYQVEAVTSPAALVRAVESRTFDLVLMDLNYTRDTTSGREGIDLLARLQALDHTLPIVIMTAWGSVDLAVEALQGGSGDFVLKPWDNNRLLGILRTQLAQGKARREARSRQAKNEMLASEIQEAREIQRGLLPGEIFQPAGYQISGAWQPAILIGGDYFDVFQTSETQTALCIADVSGKGLPAALLMSNLQAAVRSSAVGALDPRDVCAKVNSILCTHIVHEKFITCFYALLDGPQRRLLYTNAGHNPPLLIRRDGSPIWLREGGPLMGVFPDLNYEQGEARLAAGDRLVLFTDGVTEAINPGDEEFGEERLVKLVVDHRDQPAQALQAKILSAVAEFTGGDFQDDATLVVMAVE